MSSPSAANSVERVRRSVSRRLAERAWTIDTVRRHPRAIAARRSLGRLQSKARVARHGDADRAMAAIVAAALADADAP
jgi:hypothetical protein